MSFSQTSSTKPATNSLQQIRQNHRKQIRRQYIETYQRNKRKQLFKNNERYTYFHETPKEKQYENYLNNLTLQQLQSDPNNHLSYLIEMICKQKSYQWFKNRLGQVILLVHRMLGKLVNQARQRVNRIKQVLMNSSNIDRDQQYLNNKLIQQTLIYNQVFFQPLCNTKQLYFKPINQFNPLQSHTLTINNNNNNNQPFLEQIQSKKINIYLVLEFLIAVTYDITPDTFVNSVKEMNLLNTQSQTVQDFYAYWGISCSSSEKQTYNQLNVFICVYNNFYHLMMDLFKISQNIKYINGSLQQLWRQLNKLYTSSNIPNLPSLWFDVQKIFVKQSLKQNISLRTLQFFVNMTALITMNDEFDNFVHKLNMLAALQQIGRQLPLGMSQMRLIGQIYGNLVHEEITWSLNNNIKPRNKHHHSYEIEVEDEDDYDEHGPHTPGLYPNFLQYMSQRSEKPQQFTQLVYIVKTILQNYQIPPKNISLKQLIKQQQNNASHKLIMYPVDCQFIAEIIAQLFQKLTSTQAQTQFLSDLFVVVCQKLLPYLLYAHQLNEILGLVIRNQNRCIVVHQQKHKRSTTNMFQPVIEQQNKIQITTQNLKHIINECTQVIIISKQENKLFGIDSDALNLITLGHQGHNISKDFIDSMLTLWQQNQLEYCYEEFVGFVQTAVEAFPQYLIMVQKDYQQNKKFIQLLEEAVSYCEEFHLKVEVVSIVQQVMIYLCNLDMKLGGQERFNIKKYFIDFKDEWMNILQQLEGLMYSNKHDQHESTSFALRIQHVYDIIDKMLKDALQNMEIQI